MSAIDVSVLQLPWATSDSDQQFKKIVLGFLLLFFCIALPVSYVTLPELTRAEKEALPPQLARVVLEQKLIPPQPVVPPKIEEKPEVEKTPEKTNEEKNTTTPAETKPVTPDTSKTSKSDSTERARSVAKQSGILAMANELNELQNTDAITENVRTTVTATKNEAATHNVSEVITASNQQGKVIQQDDVVGQLQSTDLQTREARTQTAATEKAVVADNNLRQGKGGGRASSDISLVFNKNKASLHSIYERERRKNTSLKGKIVFQLTIEPNGKVSSVKILSSELNNPELENRIITRIKMFIFAPTSDGTITIDYPVEFIPS
ncbi:MAG: hypothetical protein B0W54_20700 [Cellvibrio sp. 79]|nr:MAG: hypothetical protein B0W54_20700 [Cellvibrio sp. 79]